MPADAGVDHRRARGLDPAREMDHFIERAALIDEIQHREAVDQDEIPPHRGTRAPDDFDGEADAVLIGTAPLVGTVIGARGDELVDEVAFAAHDLDAVIAGLAREFRAAHEGRDLPQHAARTQHPGRERRNRGAQAARGNRERVISVAARVQDLHAEVPALGVHGFRHEPVTRQLTAYTQLARKRRDPARAIGRDATRDDEARAAARPLGEVGGELRKIPGLVLEAGVHRTHQDTVAQPQVAEIQRREESRKLRLRHGHDGQGTPSGRYTSRSS